MAIPKSTPAKKKQTKITGFTTAVKTKPKSNTRPNASILNYFKKAADEDLFIGDGAGVGVEGVAEEEEEEDIYGAGDLYKAKKGREEKRVDRFNEIGTPVKRRKLSGGGGDSGETDELAEQKVPPTPKAASTPKPKSKPSPMPQDKNSDGSRAATSLVAQDQKSNSEKRPRPQPPTKRRPNPFIDDSDDEIDDDGCPGWEEVKKNQGTSRAQDNRKTILGRDGLTFREMAPLLREETSGNDLGQEMEAADPDETAEAEELTDDPDDLFDDSFTGEEFREMQYMQEQARLEAEEAGIEYEEPYVEDNSLMEECCPICNGSLAGVSETQATAHVNACLDGHPTPLPLATSPPSKKTPALEDHTVDSPEIAKRFSSKAAVPRPGQAIPFRLDDGGPDTGSSSTSAFTKLMSAHTEDAAWAAAAAAEHSSRGMPAYKRTCPFYKIMPNLSICVDAFRYGAVESCTAYFLSHFHSDHYIGLTAKWTHGPIYCSKVTGSLVRNQLKTADKYVVELEFDEKVPVPNTNGVFVTMIPANHCPGSSLFLFEKASGGGGKTQRILHCGDFRACREHITHPGLRPNLFDAVEGKIKQQKIDICYLDTTYLNPRYSFPPQDDVVRSCAELCVTLNDGIAAGDESRWDSLLRKREGGAPNGRDSVSKFFNAGKEEKKTSKGEKGVKENDDSTDKLAVEDILITSPKTPDAFTAIQNKPSNRNRLLIVCGTYSIGKERICKAIAQALNTKIFASPAKIRICQQLNDPELSALMTSDPREAQVHMQMLMEIRAETLAEYLELHRGYFSRVVGFRPSGWNYRPGSSSSSPSSSTSKRRAAESAIAKLLGNTTGGHNGSGIKNVTASMAPGSVPTTHLLHGPGWRTQFSIKDLTPQRGSCREAMCFGVPYSEHSSFRELALFLMALRIERVIPTVNVGSEQSRKRMKGWTDRWLAERRRGGVVDVLVEDEDGDGEKEVMLWDGKDGRGGGVFW